MSKIKITLPEGQGIATGMQISFVAKCACAETTCLQINNTDYTLVDALGNNIAGAAAWTSGAIITALLDVTNKKAYVLNAGTLLIAGGNITGNLGVAGNFSAKGPATFLGNIVLTKGIHYDDSLPPNSEAALGRLFFKKLPK